MFACPSIGYDLHVNMFMVGIRLAKGRGKQAVSVVNDSRLWARCAHAYRQPPPRRFLSCPKFSRARGLDVESGDEEGASAGLARRAAAARASNRALAAARSSASAASRARRSASVLLPDEEEEEEEEGERGAGGRAGRAAVPLDCTVAAAVDCCPSLCQSNLLPPRPCCLHCDRFDDRFASARFASSCRLCAASSSSLRWAFSTAIIRSTLTVRRTVTWSIFVTVSVVVGEVGGAIGAVCQVDRRDMRKNRANSKATGITSEGRCEVTR
mmetsp:Transcript_8796/g.28071  ORF Transcript_8796/g.28071 Transcript_8796/m.28071 type:complete len:269 (+) Transcript_8796:1109-1915(+)